MTASTAPLVKAALVNDDGTGLLQTIPGLAGVSVTYGHPGDNSQPEMVWLTGVVFESENLASATGPARHEIYYIDLLIDVHMTAATAQECDERCWEIFAHLETALSPAHAVQVAGVWDVDLKPRMQREGITNSGRWADLSAQIRVQARK